MSDNLIFRDHVDELYHNSRDMLFDEYSLGEWTEEEFVDSSVNEVGIDIFEEGAIKNFIADSKAYNKYKSQLGPGELPPLSLKYDSAYVGMNVGTRVISDVPKFVIKKTIIQNAVAIVAGIALSAAASAMFNKIYKKMFGRFPEDAKTFIEYVDAHNNQSYNPKTLKKLIVNLGRDANFISNKNFSYGDLTVDERETFKKLAESCDDLTHHGVIDKNMKAKSKERRIDAHMETTVKYVTDALKVYKKRQDEINKKDVINEYFS